MHLLYWEDAVNREVLNPDLNELTVSALKASPHLVLILRTQSKVAPDDLMMSFIMNK